MFTMKFFHHDGAKTVLSCARYYVREEFPKTYIDVFLTIKEDNPTLFFLELDPLTDNGAFYEVFVENESGKTIDRYRALSQSNSFNSPPSLSSKGMLG